MKFKMLKKFAAMVFAISLMTALFTGCSGPEKTPETVGGSNSAGETNVSGEIETIKFWPESLDGRRIFQWFSRRSMIISVVRLA